MTELALHILDIANNSTRAGAKTVTIAIACDTALDELSITVSDDGCGMSAELCARVVDPFATTRTTRRVGLGIPLFKQAAEQSGGSFSIKSELGKGTVTKAVFKLKSVDRVPMGDIATTLATLIGSAPETDFVFDYRVDEKKYAFSTVDVRNVLGDDVLLSEPEVVLYIREMLAENIENINGGLTI